MNTPRSRRNQPNDRTQRTAIDLTSDSTHRATQERRRITAIIGHLEICAALIDQAEHELAETEENAAWGTRTISAAQSTISSRFVGDPTGTRALSHDNHTSTIDRRDITDAIRTLERNVTHLRHTLQRCAGTANADTTKEQRCPLELRIHDGSNRHADENYVKRDCGALTASTPRPDGTGMAWRPDGYCIEHGQQADEAERRAHDSNARRQRRHAS